MKEKKSGTSQAGPGAGAAGAAGAARRTQGQWSEAAVRVLRERYLLRDATGAVVETPDELIWRVARAVASAEESWTETGGEPADPVAEP